MWDKQSTYTAYILSPRAPRHRLFILASVKTTTLTLAACFAWLAMPLVERFTRSRQRNGEEKSNTAAVVDIDTYNSARDALIKQERSRGFDATAIKTASNLEKDAAAIVNTLIDVDNENIYRGQTDERGIERDAGDHFLGNLDLINKTELLRVAQHMPKGAHLHCHFNACLHPSFLVQLARCMDTMYIRSNIPLTSEEAFDKAEISFQVLPLPEKLGDLFSADYEERTWMSYPKFCVQYQGGVEAAEQWLVKKMLFTEEEVYDIYQTCHG